MRHLKAGKRLGVTTSHRKAMMRNLVTSLLEHGEIRTTITRAKEMRKYFDKMITLGKRNDLHARRQALSFVKSKAVVKKLFDEYAPIYANRNGGYTRIYRIGNRLGDNAKMALIRMVDIGETPKSIEDAGSGTIKEVKEELEEKIEAAEEVAKESGNQGEVESEAGVEKEKASDEVATPEKEVKEEIEAEAVEEQVASEEKREEKESENKQEKDEEATD